MLAKECAGTPYNKTEHRKALIQTVGGTRERPAIEMSTRTSAL